MIIEDVLNCGWDPARFLIFSANVFGPLVYYSHIFSLITAFGLGFYVFMKNPNSFIAKIFFCITTLFSIWVFSDIILWADENPSHIMFFWSLTILLEPVLYVLGLYFIMVHATNNDIRMKVKLSLLSILVPTIILVPTRLGILGFNYTNCDREVVEGILVYYGYLVEIIISIWTAIYFMRSYKTLPIQKRKHFVVISIGMLLFFLSFAWGNIVGTISEDWILGQYGLFGMPVFLAFITYSIVKFRTFELKIIGAQALVSVLWISLMAVLFLRTIEHVRVVVSLTLILFLVVGVLLVRSVKREVEQRERIERLAKDLEVANDKLRELDVMKSEFLSMATHQIRSPLTAIKGYSSMLLEGDFGVLPQKALESVQIIFKSCQNLIRIVNDFLNISRIEQGRMVYEKTVFDMAELTREVADEMRPNIKEAGLTLDINIKEDRQFNINADKDKIRQTVQNIIDNAIKYTSRGGIKISVSEYNGKIMTEIKDTGVGIDPKEMDKLFSKFSRTKDANKKNVTGTGLGLYVAKKMVTAHGGDIKVESEGLGKGTRFIIELPEYTEYKDK